MSINWVMLKDGGKSFIPLPKERTLYTSPTRTTLSVQTSNSYPGREPLHISSNNGGLAFITNQRLVYLPSAGSANFQSFSAPILNLLDTRVTAPWFGANTWVAVLKPVTGGGIPPQHVVVELKLTFKDGGAYDFQRIFEEVKDRLSTAAETAREQGRPADLSDVPLEPLPVYQPSASGEGASATVSANAGSETQQLTAVDTEQALAPDEPPPGYEEAQSASVMASLEETVRRQNT